MPLQLEKKRNFTVLLSFWDLRPRLLSVECEEALNCQWKVWWWLEKSWKVNQAAFGQRSISPGHNLQSIVEIIVTWSCTIGPKFLFTIFQLDFFSSILLLCSYLLCLLPFILIFSTLPYTLTSSTFLLLRFSFFWTWPLHLHFFSNFFPTVSKIVSSVQYRMI